MITSSFPELVQSLYDAAAGSGDFSMLAPRIANAFNAASCQIQVRGGFIRPVERVSSTGNYTPELNAKYQDYYYKVDTWANLAMARPQEAILGSDDVISDAEYERTEIYQDYNRHLGTFYVLGTVTKIGGPGDAVGAFGVHRSRQEGLFSAEEKHRATLLLPHLKRALQLRERLGRMDIQSHAMVQALEIASVAVLLAADNGGVLFANVAAEAILRRGDGLLASHGRLHAATPSEDSSLRQQIRTACLACAGKSVEPGGVMRISRANARPLSLSFYPFVAPQLGSTASLGAALIFVGNPDLHRPAGRDALARMYGLTGAEARLFEALLAGERLQDYADRSALSVQTVKTQLGRLFDKTGHTRQTDLVRDAMSNPILSLGRK
jgi:DNA-binding CsgD family transcriptional regulator/PAS domain-containing protein